MICYFTKKIQDDNTCTHIWGYVEVIGDSWEHCRELMFSVHGSDWGFQYESLNQVHELDRNYIETIVAVPYKHILPRR